MTSEHEPKTIENWNQINDDPLAFQNVHTDTIVGVGYCEERGCWVYGGPNTMWTCDSQEEAREELFSFVRETRRPSGMV